MNPTLTVTISQQLNDMMYGSESFDGTDELAEGTNEPLPFSNVVYEPIT